MTCAAGTKTCQSNGSYSACNCTPLCEATGTGKCYYISAIAGSDSNPGSFEQPWKTYLNIVSYYSSSSRPAGWKQLQAGDIVYFMSGLYNSTYSYSSSSDVKAFFLRGIQGTATNRVLIKAYPGQKPIISAPKTSQEIMAFNIIQSSNFIIEGLEISKGYGHGLDVNESSNVEIRNNWIHDIDGLDNNNIAGLTLTAVENGNVHHNIINDNFDHTNSDTGGEKTQNSRNVVLFSGGNIRLHHNIIFQSNPISSSKTGGCVTYKHSATLAGSIFEVDNNMFWNCAFTAIGSGSYGTRIHHNLIINSEAIEIADFGGRTFNQDIIIENNTIIGGDGLEYKPTTDWGPIGLVTFRKNIVQDALSYHSERGVITVGVYQNDTLYNLVVTGGKLAFADNCYYNKNYTLVFNLFNNNNGSDRLLGSTYSFSSWKGLGYDTNSLSKDPQISASTYLSSGCENYGWLAP